MKKDPIDKLFEDKLKDYSDHPPEKVWKAIETSLDQKRKSRKVIPIWWKLGGAAAVLALLFYLISPVGVDTPPEGQVSDTKERTTFPADGQELLPDDTLNLSNGEGEVTSVPEGQGIPSSRDNTHADERSTAKPSTGKEASDTAGTIANSPGVEVAKTGNTTRAPGKEAAKPALPSENTAIVSADRRGDGNDLSDDQLALKMQENDQRVTKADAVKTEVEAPADSRPGKEAAEDKGQLAEAEKETPARKSLYDEIVEAAEQEEAIADNEGSRWSVGPKVAPVYFSSFGEGSPIHSSFASNSKSGNVNFSYGLSVSYSISPRLSIRSGVHKVDYGYDTNDISFSPTFAMNSDQQISNINYALTSRNLVVRNASEAKVAQDALSAEVTAEFPAFNGRMIQQFGYVEVPLELNLALVDRKLGLNLIGGLSSLFLVDNTVTLESDGNATEMGEANNLNPVNFSTNIGVGLQYEVTPRIQLSLEPVFKYQLNTFSDASGNFNPYSVGVYSGLNFRF